ncbi:hypothetical protein D0869_04537 [Hortaea werneckii]|uniref:Rieske domain-containing protein n=1 Tax=Hortaea werneckii TaxID=91943 RepID=A0A3M6X1M5_HORWE|nr:hypothetical protein KC324_g3728 [Hortaea werneckii]KAI7589825.1 hypothetical protein KC316_g3722 [Hortaea werneckii]RMX84490.1 hypothetical protein D0869_04537 [Hortaea werneckii]RMY03353.1 hypothetical protein D0868_07506 [Hortaea werneckii]
MPTSVELGETKHLSSSRYAIKLSTGKRLVLFQLPTIASSSTKSTDGEPNGWTYYAMEQECPHAGGPMSDAQIDIEDSSYIASCPWHAYDFNLDTGASSYGIKACVFPIRSHYGKLYLELDGDDGVTLESIEPISEKVKYKHGSRAATTDAVGSRPSDDASVCEWCAYILNTADPESKIELTTRLFSLFATREQTSEPMPIGAGAASPPSIPPRHDDLQTVKPWEIPSAGRGGTLKSRIAMLHALANIEQWAIDLALDICVRFAGFQTRPTAEDWEDGGLELPRTYFYDWLKVANDEAKHFSLLRSRLEELGSYFGALPVHHGLWQSAEMTNEDLRARISIIALVHEARGLDVNPVTIDRFRKAKDLDSVDTLEVIHRDEITHVTTGHRWLSWICAQERTDPVEVFRKNVMKHFRGAVKGPFNAEARQQAGMDGSYYEDLAGSMPVRGGDVIAGG